MVGSLPDWTTLIMAWLSSCTINPGLCGSSWCRNKKLGNPNFVDRAAPEVVDEQRQKLAEAEAGKARLQAALARLDAVG